MSRSGVFPRAANGVLVLAGILGGCSADGIKARPDSGGDETCGTIMCLTVPPSTAQCTEGRCLITLASGQGSPGTVVVDATTAYWTATDVSRWNDVVMAVPLGGGTPVTLVSSDDTGISDIAIDATTLYWLTAHGQDGTVMKAPLNGGPPTTLATGQYGPHAMALDADSVYWTNNGKVSTTTSAYVDGSVMKVPLAGGAPTTLASGVYPFAIAVDANSVYWTDLRGGSVSRVPLEGGATTTLASFRSAYSIAVDATSIYWARGSGWHDVEKAPLAGGASITLAELQYPEVATNIAVDDTNAYWITGDGKRWNVMKVPLTGGTPSTLASGQGIPGGLAMDATSVYWTTDDGDSVGTVMKLTPK